MWLIDTKDLTLTNIANRDLAHHQDTAAPRSRYGILSHRWEEIGEATFEDFRSGRPSSTGKGIGKIEAFCEVARSHGLELAWADTCQ